LRSWVKSDAGAGKRRCARPCAHRPSITTWGPILAAGADLHVRADHANGPISTQLANLRGVTRQWDDRCFQGCAVIWLSPPSENSKSSEHTRCRPTSDLAPLLCERWFKAIGVRSDPQLIARNHRPTKAHTSISAKTNRPLGSSRHLQRGSKPPTWPSPPTIEHPGSCRPPGNAPRTGLREGDRFLTGQRHAYRAQFRHRSERGQRGTVRREQIEDRSLFSKRNVPARKRQRAQAGRIVQPGRRQSVAAHGIREANTELGQSPPAPTHHAVQAAYAHRLLANRSGGATLLAIADQALLRSPTLIRSSSEAVPPAREAEGAAGAHLAHKPGVSSRE